MEEVQCTVIGAGVIGLAIARALARDGCAVMILERETRIGTQISARNSEVIHAGIYYEPGSLKALTCVRGRELIYRYCHDKNISYRRCGKLIVAASEEQLTQLRNLDTRARQNGVGDLQWLERAAATRLEPALACAAALLSPSTGIIDSDSYMLALLADAEAGGAQIAYGTHVSSLRPTTDGVEVTVAADSAPALRSRVVINSAGLGADGVAHSISDFPRQFIPRVHHVKGSYFTLAGAAPFERLIYPLPDAGGLGVHMTLDLQSNVRFGPDVEWISGLDYAVAPQRSAKFYPAIRRYWPGLADGQLQAGYAGIRPKLSGPGESAADFCISDPAMHGVMGIINLFGVESPGLTASLALAEVVAARVEEQL
jgi:L-2-hydroxyglutarate oxidase LhgO